MDCRIKGEISRFAFVICGLVVIVIEPFIDAPKQHFPNIPVSGSGIDDISGVH